MNERIPVDFLKDQMKNKVVSVEYFKNNTNPVQKSPIYLLK